MSNFTPIFPRTVSGGDYRLPLYHADVEAVAARLSDLYETISLKPEHRAMALRLYAELIEADEGIWNAMGDSPIERCPDRPRRPVIPQVDLRKPSFAERKFDTLIGFVLRVDEYCERLENSYGITAYRALGCAVERDADGNPLPDDDI